MGFYYWLLVSYWLLIIDYCYCYCEGSLVVGPAVVRTLSLTGLVGGFWSLVIGCCFSIIDY